MRQNLLKSLIAALMLVLAASNAFSQGVTTSAINGRVTDSSGEVLPGANVVATHIPSGTRYGSVTNLEGRFVIPNMRVGGPYTVVVTFIGYENGLFEDIVLSLGQSQTVNVVLADSASELDEFIVLGTADEVFDGNRTGASTKIGQEKIQTLPTISRQFNDFTRLTPQADIKGGAISIGGMNNRYNQVTIDGAVSNDVFGLSSSGTNGGATNTSPISLDAIEEFSVQIAPYDVRLGGFAGGGISAVTRSGTNDFSGSAYYYFRNEKLAGKTPGSLVPENNADFERTRYENFTDRQYGIRVGGPIIQDKLFFFLNAEKTENITPLAFAPGTPGSNITLAEVNRIVSRANELGYNPGSFLDQESTNNSDKIFGRLDWNINDKHKLSLRHSYTKGNALQLSRNPNTLTFSNGGILRESTTNSTVLEFNSRFSNTISNNLIVGFTSVREPRGTTGAPFPRVRIDLDAQRSVFLGSEAFSTVNLLEQDVFTLTDNISFYKGKHVFTVGTHNEFYSMYNAFIGQAFGDYRFNNIDGWENGLAQSFTYQYSKTDNPREGADFGAMQLGLYVQDEYQVNERFKLTYGVRLDIPIYNDSPLRNDDFNNSVLAERIGQRNDELPKPAYMISPRVGFNWDAKGDQSTQIRGGTGIFTSRFPFVWIGGAFTQSGVLLDRNNASVAAGQDPNIPFVADPYNQPKRANASGPGGNMTIVDKNFKLPQIFRTNLAIDQRLPGGIIGTIEGMYSVNLNAFRFTNLNLVEPTQNLSGADNRPLYPAASSEKLVLSNYSEVVYIDNVNSGSALSLTAQLQKTFTNGFYTSLAYSYTTSKDLFPGTSSQNQSNYYRVASVEGSNNVDLGFSPFDTRSRVTGFVAYNKSYLKNLSTSISLFYNGQSGTPFSYVYNGDLNRSSLNNNEFYNLLYVPNDASEITFVQNGDLSPQDQWNLFNSFIEQDEYLSSRRGEYVERNGARTPWTHQFDVKIMQDIFTNIGGKKNTLQLTLDIFNVGNLLNKDWGRQYTYGNSFFDNTYRLLRVAGYDGTTPQYTFNPVPMDEPYFTSDSPIGGSRWVGQVGIRYIFN
ncbi:TonB-dependent receptor [Algoriphagus sp.]|uniref:TonB-dependent receptor n=1 Tax=Algoriphagus sp. TaxID=1872435 RepID=UPI003F6E7B8E